VTQPAPPDPLRPRSRLPFEPKPFGGALRSGAVVVYALLALGLGGLAVYMALAVGHPWTSGYVAAPGIGALWFGLRLMMILGSRSNDAR